jgi:endonuclease-3
VLETIARSRGPVHWRRENPVVCLIGTILSQATNDILADRAYGSLRRRFPTWERVLGASRRSVERAIRMCGLSRQKARAIQAFLRFLKRSRGRFRLALSPAPRDVDRTLDELTRVEGIGIKTAAITLMFGCGADLCAVDTHLVRILRRLRVVPPKASPDRAFRILRPIAPPGRAIELHLQLIRFGRETCRAIRPRCGACPIRRRCPFPGNSS